MNAPSIVSFRNLSDVILGLSKASGTAIPDICDNEMARILEKSISLTPAAKVAKIRANAESREWGMHKTGIPPKRTFKGKLSPGGYKRYKYGNKYPDQVWAKISDQRKASVLEKIARRGLSKQSWLKLAQLLDLDVKATKLVQKLPANFAGNFAVSRNRGDGKYSVNIRNAQPTVNRIGGSRILKKAVAGRVKFFETNIRNGVLSEMDKFAKAYPGIVNVAAPMGGQLQ
jgi:hypothetical protein